MATPEFAPSPLYTGSTTPQPSGSAPIPLSTAEVAGKLTRAVIAIGEGRPDDALDVARAAVARLESLLGVPALNASDVTTGLDVIPPPRSLTSLACDLDAIAESLRDYAGGRAIVGEEDWRNLADDVRNAGRDVQGWADVIGGRVDVQL